MKLYLVRHGESEGNVGRFHQTATEKLTQKGQSQAKVVAQRFRGIKVDTIIASTMTRAQQTAKEIAGAINKEIISEPLFAEVKHPSVVHGKPHSDNESNKIIRHIREHKADPTFHYSDEENYFDFLKRVEKGLATLEKYGEHEQIVVVAHGHVIRAITGIILFGTEFSARNFDQLVDHLHTDNTGVSIAEFTLDRGWVLITYNDHSHLLD
ncbi:MAG: histidine phosphatase family protein [Candidatus Woesebacteria bacterium]